MTHYLTKRWAPLLRMFGLHLLRLLSNSPCMTLRCCHYTFTLLLCYSSTKQFNRKDRHNILSILLATTIIHRLAHACSNVATHHSLFPLHSCWPTRLCREDNLAKFDEHHCSSMTSHAVMHRKRSI